MGPKVTCRPPGCLPGPADEAGRGAPPSLPRVHPRPLPIHGLRTAPKGASSRGCARLASRMRPAPAFQAWRSASFCTAPGLARLRVLQAVDGGSSAKGAGGATSSPDRNAMWASEDRGAQVGRQTGPGGQAQGPGTHASAMLRRTRRAARHAERAAVGTEGSRRWCIPPSELFTRVNDITL